VTAPFDIKDFLPGSDSNRSRYERRLRELEVDGIATDSIERAVEHAIHNITKDGIRSFVIYGEPQSGKTEMMIALTARLLDEGHRIIIVLMNDSVQLLEQNLDRFLRSGLDPAPKKFNEILDPSIKISTGHWVVFCKKNSADLQKLLSKVDTCPARVVIDDEADYATPNGKINRNEQTKINELVGKLLGDDGFYIGVTATPARLDLNNTFKNANDHWVDFPPHPKYTGQNVFFPTTLEAFADLPFRLVPLPDEGDDPKYLRAAFFGFLVSVAYLNTQVNDTKKNYSMLIHTSGKKVDHTKDYQQIITLLGVLKDPDSRKYPAYVKEIFELAAKRHPGLEQQLTRYIIQNINLSDVVVMNSNTERNAAQYRRATSPATLFTVAIGGNIVSRGVTFDDLLCMFFTRDVKHKIQQDTYIQRARMFGGRGSYLKHFELHIPEALYLDWQKCFVFHQLALSSIRAGKGSPVWLEDKRIAAAAASSIDQGAVGIDSGEMSWEMFDYPDELDTIVQDDTSDSFTKMDKLASLLGEDAFPPHVPEFIRGFSIGPESLAVHPTTELGEDYGDETVRREIRRVRGFIGTNQLEKKKYPQAIHHLKIFKNEHGRARLFYKYMPEAGKIRFLRNRGRR
jgi:hypothetical protein